MELTLADLRKAAEKVGMSKAYLNADPKKQRDDMHIIGADFIDRLHAELVKNGQAK